MAFTFTSDALRAAYNYLNETPPFNKWNLPDGDDVDFKVARGRAYYGWHTFKKGKHTVAISRAMVPDTQTLLSVMAHEMIHVHEQEAKACRSDVQHTKAFMKWAAQVCKCHGFEIKGF